ncbi:MAG: ABC transporter permease [Acidobacteria bacterium]|nr:ABC transporter permease [Acidobacteriota bacterium]
MRFLYRVLLLAYPAALRRQHGDEMTAAVDEAWAEARRQGPRACARLVGRLLADFVVSLPGAWRSRPHGPASATLEITAMPVALFSQIRYACRVLNSHRASTAATVLTLALAIGLNTAVFSVVHAVVMAPLPYPEPDRLVRVWERHEARHAERNVVSPANFLAWQERTTSFTSMAAYGRRTMTLTADGAAEDVEAVAGTWNLFEVIGVQPALGRGFVAADGVVGADQAVLVSASLWQRRYGRSPDIVNRQITINGLPARVVGVLPADFEFLGDTADVWSAFQVPAAARQPRGRSWQAIARLAPGVTLGAARAEMQTINAALRQEWPDFNAGWGVSVVDAREDLVGPAGPVLLLLLGAVGVVLLVGCANTANLLLARAAQRRRELAVRTALGASRGDLLRQLFVEGAVLAGLGTIAGLAVATLALRGLATTVATSLDVPRLASASLHPTVLAFSLGLLVICALLFSVLPALHMQPHRLATGLAAGGRWATGDRADRRMRQALVVGQLALAVALVVVGGLIATSLSRLTSIDPGFDPDNVLTLHVSVPAAGYDTAATVSFFADVVDELTQLPGVEAAGAVTWLPFTGQGGATSFEVIGQPPVEAANRPVADVRPVTPGYFDALRIPLREGRLFSPAETRAGTRVILVNEALARQMFPEGAAVGRRLAVNWGTDGEDEIIGVVGDVRHDSLSAPARPMVYYPVGTSAIGFMTFVVRSRIDPVALTRSAETVIHARDRDLPVTRVQTLRAVVSRSVAAPSVTSWLVGGFAALSLLLSLVGVAGLQSASVAARTPEFGVRLALGATPAGIRRLVLSQAGGLIVVGLAVGLVLAAVLSRLAARELYGVTPLEPVAYLAAAALVLAFSLMAADIPARRATRVNPAQTLRQ